MFALSQLNPRKETNCCQCCCLHLRAFSLIGSLLMSRCCVGTESPQIAEAYLVDASYNPLCSSDVWALGLVMLEVVGGHKPEQHLDVLTRQDYLEELDGAWRDPYGPEAAPGQHRHLLYLRELLTEPGKPDYADQV